MKNVLLITAICILSINLSFAIEKNSKIDSLINTIKLDSLLKYVGEFTGENDVVINGITTRIKTRDVGKDSAYSYLAEEYLIKKFKEFAYTPLADTFNTFKAHNPDSKNIYRHIYAIKEGIIQPEKRIYICAHLDCAGDYYYLNYGADDDASGVSLVLEAARILSDIPFKYTIVFMLFNSEEVGGNSDCHIDKDSLMRDNIICGINADMIAYDGNDDKVFNLAYEKPESKFLTDIGQDLNIIYEIGLVPKLLNRGVGDDYRFNLYNIPAISFFEDAAKITDDMNPGYHSNNDRMMYFNNDYYHKMSKLIIATLAHIADNSISDINDNLPKSTLEIYPNPVEDVLMIMNGDIIEFEKVQIFSIEGIKVIEQNYENLIDISKLLPGVYFIKIDNVVKRFIKI